MSGDPKWKTELLASGLPLEFDTARVLVSKGFLVDADFKYARTGSGTLGDFSVDVRAKAAAPFSEPDQVSVTLDLLVECKHARANVAWFFLPDPNPPDHSPAARARAIRVVDKFSIYAVDADATAPFDRQLPLCYKGLEIDLDRGDVDDAEVGHKLAQLQYALPRLLAENVSAGLGGSPGQNVPFLFCPILLSTAPLLVAEKTLSVERVARASQPRDLGSEVPYLVMYSDYGPDFPLHCERECRRLEALQRQEHTLLVEKRRAGHYGSSDELPVATIESLIAGHRAWLHRLFTQFIVCTQSALPALLDAIKEAADSAAGSRKELP